MSVLIQCLNTVRSKILREISKFASSSKMTTVYFHGSDTDISADNMQHAPSAERNKNDILKVLKKKLSQDFAGRVLEVASGTGQHITLFAQSFPNATWQPSDVDQSGIKSTKAYIAHLRLTNVLEPVTIDATVPVSNWSGADFSKESFDVMLNSNMIHISPWNTAVGLFQAAGFLLKPGGLLFTYGPYAIDGVLEPESNVNFDKSLRSRDPSWGIRDVRDLKRLSAENGISLIEMVDMPTNNKTLIWQKM